VQAPGPWIPIVALAAALLAGCGGDGDSEDTGGAEDAVRAYFEAVGDGDGEAACALLTEAAQEEAEHAARVNSCEKAATAAPQELLSATADAVADADFTISEDPTGGTTVDIEVDGQTASIPVEQTADGWKISEYNVTPPS
jgi:Domain of unknown function (DUF4878)